MRSKTTLKDIALAAGVSVSTVSRVMGGRWKVDPGLQRRVNETAQRLGFDMHKGKKTRAIAFVLSNRDMLYVFHSRVLMGAELYSTKHGRDIIFLTNRYSANVPWKQLRLPSVIGRRDIVGGVVLAGTNSQNYLDLLDHEGIPVVVLGNNVLGEWNRKDYDAVYSNEVQGALDLTRYLQAVGHKDIWFAGNCHLPWCARCFDGYRQAMEEANLNPMLSEIDSEDDKTVGYLAAKSIISQSKSVTAVFAGTDAIAQGAYRGFRDCGLRIPEDISIVGCNDTCGSSLHPPLTTINEFPEQLGKALVKLLVERVLNPDVAPRQVLIPTELVKRESCREIIVSSKTESTSLHRRSLISSRG